MLDANWKFHFDDDRPDAISFMNTVFATEPLTVHAATTDHMQIYSGRFDNGWGDSWSWMPSYPTNSPVFTSNVVYVASNSMALVPGGTFKVWWLKAGTTPFLRSSYMYYPQIDQLVNPANVNLGYRTAKKQTQLSSVRVLLTDLIYDYDSIPHRAGKNPAALNVAMGDGHASISTTKAAFDQTLWTSGGSPGDSESPFLGIVSRLQP